MYFYGIMSQRPTCLYRGKGKNFVIIEAKKEKGVPVYELLINVLSKQDALDICIQEDSGVAKMMLEMQLYGKTGNEENIIGKEKEIILALGQTKEAKTAMALIKNIDATSTSTKIPFNSDKFDETEQQELLAEIQKSFGGDSYGYFK